MRRNHGWKSYSTRRSTARWAVPTPAGRPSNVRQGLLPSTRPSAGFDGFSRARSGRHEPAIFLGSELAGYAQPIAKWGERAFSEAPLANSNDLGAVLAQSAAADAMRALAADRESPRPSEFGRALARETRVAAIGRSIAIQAILEGADESGKVPETSVWR